MQTESNLGVMKDQCQYYNVAPLRVLGMLTLNMGVKSLINQHLDIHWYQMVELR